LKSLGPHLVKIFLLYMEPEFSLPRLQETLSQVNLVNALPNDSIKIHFNIIVPSTRRSSTWSACFRFPHQKPTRPSSLQIPEVRHLSNVTQRKYKCAVKQELVMKCKNKSMYQGSDYTLITNLMH